ncbi:MAG: bifunctional diaminohydroxyphosphoribosylaminopyrimidine deaminase/5-amino-6-(5-phosphoribosylamino)uracil reductase RibD [Candidatus Tectomicrobia bacterium]|uniref:Riboflavin biosynthesis protein RibD n=1 Tax=Tectimicrobiota bacterium TaxID=2528274 RepID=A0A932I0H1_UNCTE|nr:bifunctional diaminohydroxyphosphoribosylaminopyrimidine deaminase/5-amino-6-(5-phosphoribosylamino)uracil reductase RibD [Candidatus Tectomicrobia bacterium]
MGEALVLAARGAGRTSPNPAVGAVVLDAGGRPAGQGFHERAGAPHAEAVALREAGERARGGTLYITLEPCAHQGRTPPCAPAVAGAGVTRVVAAVQDPDPRTAGRGFQILVDAGIRVEVGLRAREAVRLNEGFFTWHRDGRPLVTLKAAASLDGRIASRAGASRWLTGEKARAWAHGYRDRVDAILVGVETVLRDDPLLTSRPEGREGKPILRVILDSRLKTPETAKVLPPDREVATILAATRDAPADKEALLRRKGAEVLRLGPSGAGRVPLAPLLRELGERGVRHLLVEGGGRVHGAFLREGLAHKVLFFLAPLIMGDESARGAVAGLAPRTPGQALRLSYVRHEALGEDLLVEGYLAPPVWADFGEDGDV